MNLDAKSFDNGYMPEATRKFPISPLTAAVLLFILGATVAYFMFKPKPPFVGEESVVGDRISACAFPSDLANTPAMAQALLRMDGEVPTQFDEFRNWTEALKAGYRKCPETQLVVNPSK